MSNCIFGWPIYSDAGPVQAPSLSGGSWLSTLPLRNVQDRRPSRVARSTDATTTSTQFTTNLGVARPVRVIAVLLPNISSNATVRVIASNTADFATLLYDSGYGDTYPSTIDRETIGNIPPTFLRVVPTVSAQYWRVLINDTTNPDGYVDVARLVLAGGWQPTVNMATGARLGLETATERMVTDWGTHVYNEKPVARTLEFSIDMLSDDEAMQNAFDMQRIAGIAGQMYFVFDPQDTEHMHQRSFLCVLRTLSAIDFVSYDFDSVPFQLLEEL